MFRKLKKFGLLGINARIGRYMNPLNPREFYPLVDDKTITAKLAQKHGIPTPENYQEFFSYGQLKSLGQILSQYPSFVIKPAKGAMGNGILVIESATQNGFALARGTEVSLEDLRYHILQILSGLYSLSGLPDQAILQYKVQPHPVFEKMVTCGVPDIRVIVYKGYPVMAMVRLPSVESNGRANLHQGAVGVGVCLQTGELTTAAYKDDPITHHPDTGCELRGFKIPHWERVLGIAAQCYDITRMGYLGVDLVIDAELGPLVLEMNARPGLSIQVANQKGLRAVLKGFEGKIGTTNRDAQQRVVFSLGTLSS